MENRAASQNRQQLQHRQQHIWQYETGSPYCRMGNFWGHKIFAIFAVRLILQKYQLWNNSVRVLVCQSCGQRPWQQCIHDFKNFLSYGIRSLLVLKCPPPLSYYMFSWCYTCHMTSHGFTICYSTSHIWFTPCAGNHHNMDLLLLAIHPLSAHFRSKGVPATQRDSASITSQEGSQEGKHTSWSEWCGKRSPQREVDAAPSHMQMNVN